MPRVKPEERKRARRPKTRTGCVTCKARRVKCDEERPTCRRCRGAGRDCTGPGYGSDAHAATADDCVLGIEADNHSAEFSFHDDDPDIDIDIDIDLDDVALATNASFALLASSTLTDPLATPDESRALTYYLSTAAVQLAGFYECSFWNRMVIQGATQDLAIRHGLVALAALHEEYSQLNPSALARREWALRQYNRAIRQHLNTLTPSNTPISTPLADICIATCVIFACIEILQDHWRSAASLIRGAIRLLSQYHPNPDAHTDSPVFSLEAMLARLQLQTNHLIGADAAGPLIPPRSLVSAFPTIPETFTSLAHARDCCEYFSTRDIFFPGPSVRGEARGFITRVRTFLDLLDQWSLAFERLRASLAEAELTPRVRAALTLLRIRRLIAWIFVDSRARSATVDDQSTWDEYGAEFADILDLATYIAAHESHTFAPGASPTHPSPRFFTLQFSFIAPVFDVATRCRDPAIRRRAIAFLRAYPSRQGLADGPLDAAVAERIMRIEEAGAGPRPVRCAADVPLWARVLDNFSMKRVVGGERATVLRYALRPKAGCGVEPVWHEEVVFLDREVDPELEESAAAVGAW